MRKVLDYFVPGMPATKGSVNVGPRGQVRQASRGYAAWSAAVERYTKLAMDQICLASDCDGTVGVSEVAVIQSVFFVPGREDDGSDNWLAWVKGDGDGDKLDRCTWDAITKAGVWQDDAQVVSWMGARVPRMNAPYGAHLIVSAMSFDDYRLEIKKLEIAAVEASYRVMFRD